MRPTLPESSFRAPFRPVCFCSRGRALFEGLAELFASATEAHCHPPFPPQPGEIRSPRSSPTTSQPSSPSPSSAHTRHLMSSHSPLSSDHQNRLLQSSCPEFSDWPADPNTCPLSSSPFPRPNFSNQPTIPPRCSSPLVPDNSLFFHRSPSPRATCLSYPPLRCHVSCVRFIMLWSQFFREFPAACAVRFGGGEAGRAPSTTAHFLAPDAPYNSDLRLVAFIVAIARNCRDGDFICSPVNFISLYRSLELI